MSNTEQSDDLKRARPRNNVIHVAFGARRVLQDSDGRFEVEERGRLETLSAPPSASPSDPQPEAPEKLRERPHDPTADLYTIAEAARVLGLPESRLRSWARTEFLGPSGREGRRRLYTFQDLIGLRTAKGLLSQGIPLRSVRQSVEALRASLPRVARPLAELRVVADGPHVVVRSNGSAFDATTGQLMIDFDVKTLRDDVVRLVTGPREDGARAAYDHYLEGCRLDEDEATFDVAEQAYRRAIELDPALGNALTNLGNLRFRRGFPDDAEALYRRALAIDPDQPEAQYNLGFLAYERGDVRFAATSFERALASDPAFSDAHFNLAMALSELGDMDRAKKHWRTYLDFDPRGPWAEIARRHLGGA